MVNNGPQQALIHSGQLRPAKPKGPSVASQLVAMAGRSYTLGVSDDGTPYGTEPGRPHIALPLRGGKLGFRAALAQRYFQTHRGFVPSSQALANAITVLEGYAAQQPPRPLHLRVAAHNGAVYIDTADDKDRVIEISGGTWSFANGNIPVMFQRTKQTAPMPDPSARRRAFETVEVHPDRRSRSPDPARRPGGRAHPARRAARHSGVPRRARLRQKQQRPLRRVADRSVDRAAAEAAPRR